MDIDRLISDRARAIDASGIRKIFDAAGRLKNPINLSIGQPDFPVPEQIKAGAVRAIDADRNGYTPTQGVPELLERIAAWLRVDLGWEVVPASAGTQGGASALVTTGTSGALTLALLALLSPGDELVIPDPYFVAYPHLARMCAGTPVLCDTAPDMRMTAARVEPLLTDRTKAVVLNSPSNPCGVVSTKDECRELLELCRSRGVLLISDEIYDEFTYEDAQTDLAMGDATLRRCPSPARFEGASEDVLLIRGFGKTYGCTGWRLGYAAGPAALLAQMAKMQQYTFVCAPAPLQVAVAECFDVDMGAHVREYQRRRDLVIERLAAVSDVPTPGGAFYAFPRIPERLGLTGTEFVERCMARNLLVIPGAVFSARDDRVRVSYATALDKLEAGLDILVELMTA
ncbi:MAG: aminotransferase class I/II-fold pyridoxal phosphate-dependent enzyme [Phycisphaerales bacterium]